jgi:hypothetical protein
MMAARCAVPLTLVLLGTAAWPARADDDRTMLNRCKALVERAAQSQSAKPDDTECSAAARSSANGPCGTRG